MTAKSTKPVAKKSPKREQHRIGANRFTQRLRAAYDGARTSPETERYWQNADLSSPRSANDKPTRDILRQRSRYEARESNSFARGMLTAKTNDVIGTGPQLQVNSGSKASDQQIEAAWAAWVRATNLSSKLRCIYSAWQCDGEVFVERVLNPQLPSEVQIDLRITEADLWTDPTFTGVEPNNVDGIFLDAYGNPIRYRRLLTHPGDQFGFTMQTLDVPAEDVIHVFSADRPDQKRGIPALTPALPLFAELRRYRLATITAAETAADFSAMMYSDAPAFGDAPDELDEDFFSIDIERRSLMTLPAGWKMAQLKPEQPVTVFNEFCDAILKEIGRVMQMPLNIISGSSRDFNFASGRLDYILYWNACDVERSAFSPMVMDRLFYWWMQEAMLVPGLLPGNIDFTVPYSWVYPSRRPIDEVSAARADQIRFNLGQLTDEDWCKREGFDIETFYSRLESTIERRNAIGAPIPAALPGTITQQGTVPNEQEQPPE